ncbi:MAG: hypothetical protein LC130_22010 [Bryobacterales bacterium]|nr:hypothetical protein [Bryobacterales bacterium]MEB2362490.1 hypothetical protein [Bryobacterales bacterium]
MPRQLTRMLPSEVRYTRTGFHTHVVAWPRCIADAYSDEAARQTYGVPSTTWHFGKRSGDHWFRFRDHRGADLQVCGGLQTRHL